jgi:hypothetical protein
MTRVRDRALGVAGAVLAALAVWVVADPLLGVDMTVSQPGQEPLVVNAGPVVFASLMSSLLGWAALALLERFTARGTLVWTVLAVVALVVSMLPVLTVDATDGAKVTLALLHVAVAAVLVPVFRRTGKPTGR